MSDTLPPAGRQRTVAQMRRDRWPGWIWAVPIAAVAIVLWLTIREISLDGVTATITFARAAGIKQGDTEVRYRGVKVGHVHSVSLNADGTGVVVQLDIERRAERYLRTGTRFYLEGVRPSLSDLGSLKALVDGPTIEMVPGDGAPARSFAGISGAAPEPLATSVPYRVHLDGPVGELRAGSAVTLRGFKVGEVLAVDLSVDAADGTLDTSAVIALDPRRFHLTQDSTATPDWPQAMNAALDLLIRHDLRAGLTRSPPLIGSPEVELSTVAGAPPETLRRVGAYYEIPGAQQTGMEHLVQEAEGVPIKEIGANLRAITAQIRSLTASPKLQSSIGHLDSALASLDRTLNDAGPKVAPTLESIQKTVDSLRRTAQKLDGAADAARELMGTSPAASASSLAPALLHITEAARSIRVLADYLDEHPESLIRGRRP